MLISLYLALLFLVTACTSTVNRAYTNFSLYRASISLNQFKQISSLEPEVDIWSVRSSGQGTDSAVSLVVDVLVPPAQRTILFSLFNTTHNHVECLDIDVGHTIAEERVRLANGTAYSRHQRPADFFDDFQKYEDILSYTESLVTQYNDWLELLVAGRTYEGRNIYAVKLSVNNLPNKPGLHFQAQVHAREWLASPSLLYSLTSLLEDYAAGNHEVIALLDAADVYVTPMVNIDGYLHTWNSNRMWRKNRHSFGGGIYGVDINRNWGPENTWCSSGSSTNPSSDTYCGESAFSEPETSTMRDFIESLGGNIKAGIDFHTYGPLLLWPWQYTYNRLPEPEYSNFVALGRSMENALNAEYNTGFVSQQGSDLYPHSGGYVDYNYVQNNMRSFTLEGRGNSFSVPPSNIIPAGRESYTGIKALMQYVVDQQ